MALYEDFFLQTVFYPCLRCFVLFRKKFFTFA